MKNTRRFTRHAKKITLSGNVKFNHKSAHDPYSIYAMNKRRDELTRIELLQSYFMVTEWFNGEDLILKVDDKKLLVIADENSDAAHFMDTETGEVMLTLEIDYVKYRTPWSEELYRWGK